MVSVPQNAIEALTHMKLSDISIDRPGTCSLSVLSVSDQLTGAIGSRAGGFFTAHAKFHRV